MKSTEFGFIDNIANLFGDIPSNGFEGIGDDCAVLPISQEESLVYTTDLLCEGVHFLRHATSPRDLGHKSLAVNLSDVAAMGVRPVATLLSLSIPKDISDEWLEEFMAGYHALSQQFSVALIGGDTTRSEQGLTISVTAIGRGKTEHLKRRSEAHEGDILFSCGKLGASGAGLQDILRGDIHTPSADIHRRPMPQIEEGVWLGEHPEVHAMMDISDGIASDVRHIMEKSHVGVDIHLEDIPVAERADLRLAATGGEDYKLLFSVDASASYQLQVDFEKHFSTKIYPIGIFTAKEDLRWLVKGKEKELDWCGFRHY